MPKRNSVVPSCKSTSVVYEKTVTKSIGKPGPKTSYDFNEPWAYRTTQTRTETHSYSGYDNGEKVMMSANQSYKVTSTTPSDYQRAVKESGKGNYKSIQYDSTNYYY